MSSEHPAPRGTVGLLRDPTFGPYFAGNLASNVGSWVHNVAAAVVVFEITGSAAWTGAVSAALWAGSMVLQPYAGAVSDRVDRRRMMIGAQGFAMACAVALTAMSIAAGGADELPGPLPVVLATLGIGIGLAFSIPAMLALVPALVEDEELEHAVALNSVTFNLARALGPALAALILLVGDATIAFAFNACSYGLLIFVLLLITPRAIERGEGGDGSVREGLRYVRERKVAVLLLVGTAGVGIAADPVNTLTPPLAAQLGGSDGLVGAMVSSFGAGAFTAALVNRALRDRLDSQQATATAGLALAAGMLTLALAPAIWMALLGLYIGGAGFMTAVASINSELQRFVPEELRGRVMALWGLAFLGTRPVAALVDGALADLTSPELAGSAFAAFGLLTVWSAIRVAASDGRPEPRLA
ncbi:MAG: MFS transporter [Solirubrobacterales bacterium]